MSRFNAEYLHYDDVTGRAQMVRNEHYDYDDLPTPYTWTQDDYDALNADTYTRQLYALGFERTEQRRAVLMAPALHLHESHPLKREIARRCAVLVEQEIARIEREVEEMTR